MTSFLVAQIIKKTRQLITLLSLNHYNIDTINITMIINIIEYIVNMFFMSAPSVYHLCSVLSI